MNVRQVSERAPEIGSDRFVGGLILWLGYFESYSIYFAIARAGSYLAAKSAWYATIRQS